MIAEYYKQSQKCDCYYSSTDYLRCRKHTYTSCLKYLDSNGIIVKMPSHAATPPNTGKEGLFESGLLRHRKLWEKSEADVFVNGEIFTGIPIITDKDTLRVDNNSSSYSIPIKKIDCIRTTDGLSCSHRKQFDKNDNA